MFDTFFLLHVIVTRASCNVPVDLRVAFELNLITVELVRENAFVDLLWVYRIILHTA